MIYDILEDLLPFFDDNSDKISNTDYKFIKKFIASIYPIYDEDSYECKELCSKLKMAFSYEFDKSYSSSADYYIEIYEEIKDTDKLPYSEKNEAKKFFQNKIAKMKYNHAYSFFYNDNNYYEAINLFKEYIDDKYMTSDIKLDCQIELVNNLKRYGDENKKNKSYWNAKENYEEALNYLNSNWKVRNKYSDINYIKMKLSGTLIELAKENWSNNITSMETAMDYLRKAKNLYNVSSIEDFYLRAIKLYYYCYKACYESSSNRTSNLDMARKFQKDGSFSAFNGIFSNCGIDDVNYLYNKSRNIDNLESQIGQKRNNISNLNYELNSINNNINNTQSMIKAKKNVISNKNSALYELNNLANTLISNGNEINNETKDAINEGKNQVNEVKENIKEKKEFVEEIAKLENQKKEDIENMKNNNKNLKQKNEQLMLMLTALESKLN